MINIYSGNNKPHRVVETNEYNIIFRNNNYGFNFLRIIFITLEQQNQWLLQSSIETHNNLSH